MRKIDAVWSHFYVEYKKAEVIETEGKLVEAKMGERGRYRSKGRNFQF